MPGKGGVTIFELGIGRGAIPMVLKFECPECGKGEKSEVVEVLPERRYRMKCANCECTYILTASANDEKRCKETGKEYSGSG